MEQLNTVILHTCMLQLHLVRCPVAANDILILISIVEVDPRMMKAPCNGTIVDVLDESLCDIVDKDIICLKKPGDAEQAENKRTI